MLSRDSRASIKLFSGHVDKASRQPFLQFLLLLPTAKKGGKIFVQTPYRVAPAVKRMATNSGLLTKIISLTK